MRLITFQDRYVLEKIKFEEENERPPMYLAKELYFEEKEMYIINKFINRMKEVINFPKDKKLIPIWCWKTVKSDNIDDKIKMYFERFRPKAKELVLLDLEVPNDGVFISNFNIWRNILCDLKFDRFVSDEKFEKLFEKQKGSILQGCIPFIYKDFVNGVRYLNRYIDKDYSRTDEEIRRMMDNNELVLDANGNIWSLDNPNDR